MADADWTMDLPQLNFANRISSNVNEVDKSKNDITGLSGINEISDENMAKMLAANDVSEIDDKMVFKFNLDNV